MSPELVKESCYNAKSDVWALGCLLYELCALEPPFVASTQTLLNKRIETGNPPSLPSYYSKELDSVIRAMLHVQVFYFVSLQEARKTTQYTRSSST